MTRSFTSTEVLNSTANVFMLFEVESSSKPSILFGTKVSCTEKGTGT